MSPTSSAVTASSGSAASSASAARASTTGAGQPLTGPPGRRPTPAWPPGYGRCTRNRGGAYGAPRITAELREENGEALHHKRVARIMRALGIEGVRWRRRHRTTVPAPAAVKAPGLIGRDFTADKPNTKYVGDITCLPVDGGKFCYLATVIDLASRRLAGWAIADRRLQMAPPLQHPTPTLPPRTTTTDRLRERPPTDTNYAGTSRITRFQDSGSRPVNICTMRWHSRMPCALPLSSAGLARAGHDGGRPRSHRVLLSAVAKWVSM
ncbi:IS3 family transposase [Streptomyces sp. DH41]|uniref:IS3 family transposase n=1 Tax=Streptomyces sp. DH41 TaxID=3040125 RepID=UPI003FA7C9F6